MFPALYSSELRQQATVPVSEEDQRTDCQLLERCTGQAG